MLVNDRSLNSGGARSSRGTVPASHPGAVVRRDALTSRRATKASQAEEPGVHQQARRPAIEDRHRRDRCAQFQGAALAMNRGDLAAAIVGPGRAEGDSVAKPGLSWTSRPCSVHHDGHLLLGAQVVEPRGAPRRTRS